jgi:hypothetical protein
MLGKSNPEPAHYLLRNLVSHGLNPLFTSDGSICVFKIRGVALVAPQGVDGSEGLPDLMLPSQYKEHL